MNVSTMPQQISGSNIFIVSITICNFSIIIKSQKAENDCPCKARKFKDGASTLSQTSLGFYATEESLLKKKVGKE